MTNKHFSTNLNPVVRQLNKDPRDFTKEDIIQFVENNEIKMLNFHYVGGDGRIKTLNFVVSDSNYLEQVLSHGERVDGSSLFSFVEAGSSDLYVIPRFRTAFVDSFAELPTLGLLCSYYTKDGKPLEISPEYILKKAAKSFKSVTGMEFQAMGELEFYVVGKKEALFLATDQKGYHESSPFAKFENVFLTPHSAGSTEESRRRALDMALDNVALVLNGKLPVNCVNRNYLNNNQ